MLQCPKRVVYQVADPAAARRWYAEILETEPVYETPFGVVFNVGGAALTLVPGEAALPDDTGRMSVFWEVEDVDKAHERLLAAGARPHMDFKNIHMIRIAKVVDPFGNVLGLTGPIPGLREQTVENQPSRTAVGVALCRALATYDERPELKGPDDLAGLFLSEEGRAALKTPATRAKVISEFLSSRRYGYLNARTAFIERLFEAALRDDTPQIVFLGAGYDTRTHRHADTLGNTTVFELDIATTQNRKREILEKANVPTPPQLRYVTINFRTESLSETLCKAGFRPSERTLFVWEGVTYYLAREAIDATLGFVRHNSPAGSSICFDYMTTKMESVFLGEPFLFWAARDEMESFLLDRGFQIREHLDYRRIEEKYLTLSDGTVAEGAMPQFAFAHAAVA